VKAYLFVWYDDGQHKSIHDPSRGLPIWSGVFPGFVNRDRRQGVPVAVVKMAHRLPPSVVVFRFVILAYGVNGQPPLLGTLLRGYARYARYRDF
jgi:hypothetical protein